MSVCVCDCCQTPHPHQVQSPEVTGGERSVTECPTDPLQTQSTQATPTQPQSPQTNVPAQRLRQGARPLVPQTASLVVEYCESQVVASQRVQVRPELPWAPILSSRLCVYGASPTPFSVQDCLRMRV